MAVQIEKLCNRKNLWKKKECAMKMWMTLNRGLCSIGVYYRMNYGFGVQKKFCDNRLQISHQKMTSKFSNITTTTNSPQTCWLLYHGPIYCNKYEFFYQVFYLNPSYTYQNCSQFCPFFPKTLCRTIKLQRNAMNKRDKRDINTFRQMRPG